jgi:hypothetical protein
MGQQSWVVASFGVLSPSMRQLFPRRACPELAEGRESSPSTAHFHRFPEWIPAFVMQERNLLLFWQTSLEAASGILNLAHQLGFPLPIKATYGICVWEKLWKQCGFTRPR